MLSRFQTQLSIPIHEPKDMLTSDAASVQAYAYSTLFPVLSTSKIWLASRPLTYLVIEMQMLSSSFPSFFPEIPSVRAMSFQCAQHHPRPRSLPLGEFLHQGPESSCH